MDVSATLNQAIAALKAGRREEGRRLLESVLVADKRNEQAWLWMSGAVDNDRERIVCLENVLTINPYNQKAAKVLEALGRTTTPVPSNLISPLATPHPVVEQPPAPIRQAQEPLPPAALIPAEQEIAPSRPHVADYRTFISILMLLAIMLVCVVLTIVAFVFLSG